MDIEKMNPFFRSLVEQDRNHIVICDLNHTIIYMNPAAVVRLAKRGGASLIGRSLLDCHNEHSKEMICKVAAWFAKSPDNNIVHTYYNEEQAKDVYMVALRDPDGKLIGYYEKHEYRTRDDSPVYQMD